MKTRLGFVSNSSSASFIIHVPKSALASAQALHDYMYGEKIQVFTMQYNPAVYGYNHYSTTSLDLARAIFAQAVGQGQSADEGDMVELDLMFDDLAFPHENIEGEMLINNREVAWGRLTPEFEDLS
jgi:hypothetical protein